MRRGELKRLWQRLPNLSSDDRDLVETFSKQLLNKLLHHPTERLKEGAGNGLGVVERMRPPAARADWKSLCRMGPASGGVAAGGRIRSTTPIGEGAASVASVAVGLARPDSLFASSLARSYVRLDTTSPRIPSRPSASTTNSAVVPAPRIITWRPSRPPKILAADLGLHIARNRQIENQ